MVDLAPLKVPKAVAPPLYPGDPAPWFVVPTDANPRFQFATLGGRRMLMSFLPSLSKGQGKVIADALLAGAARFASSTSALMLVTADPDDLALRVDDNISGVRFMFDPDRAVAKLYGVAADDGALQPMTFLVDERMRIAAVLRVREDEDHAAKAFAALDRFGAARPARAASPQAPVLIIPNVFEPALCKALIDGYERNGGVESGFMVERDGMTVQEHDYGHKRRSDWAIGSQQIINNCRQRIHRRIAPEVQRAYQFHASRIERYIVACYDAETSGHFSPHRDNTTRGTAHRRFAVSINLNDDYDGGYLVFPEFGRAHFKPPAGGACVFSCSLLHEATSIKRGKRYVFVPFLYDEGGRIIRDENSGFLA